MKITICNKIRVGGLIMVYFLIVNLVAASENLGNPSDALTTEETVGAVFLRTHHRVSWNVYKKANPNAKEALYTVLEDAELTDYHQAVWRIMGFIGDSNSVNVIEAKIRSFTGELNERNQETMRAMFESLGLMAGRGVQEASSMAERLAVPAYWTNLSLSWPGKFRSELEIILWLNDGFALSGKTNLVKKMSLLVGEVTDGRTKEYVLWRTSSERLTSHRESVNKSASEAIEPELRQGLSTRYNGDMLRPKPRVSENPSNINNGNLAPVQRRSKEIGVKAEVSSALKQEAINTYKSIVDNLLNDRYEELAKSIADNGKPLLPFAKQTETSVTARAAKLKAMTRDLESTKNIIRDVQTKNLNYGDAVGEALSDGTLIVKIPCIGSNETKARHLPQQHDARTVDAEERLVIYMIKQDGHWFWNPFGW